VCNVYPKVFGGGYFSKILENTQKNFLYGDSTPTKT
jgi:hypothetical protein